MEFVDWGKTDQVILAGTNLLGLYDELQLSDIQHIQTSYNIYWLAIRKQETGSIRVRNSVYPGSIQSHPSILWTRREWGSVESVESEKYFATRCCSTRPSMHPLTARLSAGVGDHSLTVVWHIISVIVSAITAEINFVGLSSVFCWWISEDNFIIFIFVVVAVIVVVVDEVAGEINDSGGRSSSSMICTRFQRPQSIISSIFVDSRC